MGLAWGRILRFVSKGKCPGYSFRPSVASRRMLRPSRVDIKARSLIILVRPWKLKVEYG